MNRLNNFINTLSMHKKHGLDILVSSNQLIIFSINISFSNIKEHACQILNGKYKSIHGGTKVQCI